MVIICVAGLATQAHAQSLDVRAEFPAKPDFSRYATPEECAEAVQWQETRAWRDQRPDTLYTPPAGRSLAPATVTAVRACLARFSVSTVPARELLGLARAYLATVQGTRADSALERLATTVASASVTERAATYRHIVNAYLRAPFPALARAESYVARLDALGTSAALDRMMVHLALAAEARRRDSVPLQLRESLAAVSASKELASNTRREYAFDAFTAYESLADVKARQRDGEGARLVLARANAALVPYRPRVQGMYAEEQQWYTLVGKAAPTVHGRWFGAAGDTLRPVRGVPGLVVFVAHWWGEDAFPSYAVLRRLAERYAAVGLTVTLVTRTYGYYHGGLVNPDTEVLRDSAYFLGHLHLPGALVVWNTTFVKRNDGRLLARDAPNEDAYQPLRVPAMAYVVDKQGLVRFATNLSSQHEAALRGVLDEIASSPSP